MTAHPSNDYQSRSTRESWKNTILAGLANHIDWGSIVAGATALAIWADVYHLSTTFVGLIGALVRMRFLPALGRLSAGGCAMYFQPWMIVMGYFLVGLLVGVGIPSSLSLIAELAPAEDEASTAAQRKCSGC